MFKSVAMTEALLELGYLLPDIRMEYMAYSKHRGQLLSFTADNLYEYTKWHGMNHLD
jgi:hypothetical protein